MSEAKISSGYFGLLLDRVDPKTRNERQDSLPEGFELSYDGKMIYTNEEKCSNEVGLIFANPVAIVARAHFAALGYEVEKVKFYVCHWHNGSDSPMSTASPEEVFL